MEFWKRSLEWPRIEANSWLYADDVTSVMWLRVQIILQSAGNHLRCWSGVT